MLSETTIPEAPALIIPPGYDPRPRRWRAIWARRYSDDALNQRVGALLPIEETGEGESPEAAIDALLRPLCARGVLKVGDVFSLEVLEVGEEDIPIYWIVELVRDANGVWTWRNA